MCGEAVLRPAGLQLCTRLCRRPMRASRIGLLHPVANGNEHYSLGCRPGGRNPRFVRNDVPLPEGEQQTDSSVVRPLQGRDDFAADDLGIRSRWSLLPGFNVRPRRRQVSIKSQDSLIFVFCEYLFRLFECLQIRREIDGFAC